MKQVFLVGLVMLCPALAQQGRHRATYMMKQILAMASSEFSQTTQMCVMNGIGPGFVDPGVTSRGYAAVATTMYNAWTRFDKVASPTIEYTDYDKDLKADDHDIEDAITIAAGRMIEELLVERSQRFYNGTSLRQHLREHVLEKNVNIAETSDVAKQAISGVSSLRRELDKDGWNEENCYVDKTNFFPVNDACDRSTLETTENSKPRFLTAWQPIVDNGTMIDDFLYPHVGVTKLFSDLQIHDLLAPNVGDDAWFEQQMRNVIERTKRLFGQNGNMEGKIHAEFFAYGFYNNFPAGWWMELTIMVIDNLEMSLGDAIKVMFVVANAAMDGSIIAVHNKRIYNSVTPSSYIACGKWAKETFEDAYIAPYCPPGTVEGWQWRPYLPTPIGADYVSAHSTVSSAAAAALELLIDSPTIPEPNIPWKRMAGSSLVEPQCFKNNTDWFGFECTYMECPTDPEYNSENYYVPRENYEFHFRTFQEIADLTGISRVVSGVHTEAADLQGRVIGAKVGEAAYKRATELFKDGDYNPDKVDGGSTNWQAGYILVIVISVLVFAYACFFIYRRWRKRKILHARLNINQHFEYPPANYEGAVSNSPTLRQKPTTAIIVNPPPADPQNPANSKLNPENTKPTPENTKPTPENTKPNVATVAGMEQKAEADRRPRDSASYDETLAVDEREYLDDVRRREESLDMFGGHNSHSEIDAILDEKDSDEGEVIGPQLPSFVPDLLDFSQVPEGGVQGRKDDEEINNVTSL